VSLLVLILGLAVVLLSPRLRQALQWRLPGVREASLAQLGSSLSSLLQSGCSFQEAVAFMSQLTSNKPLKRELDFWQSRLASGVSRFADLVPPNSLLPPLWIWMVASSGEQLAEGLQRAAELYESRARYRYELCLYAVLPVSVLVLGGVVLGQVYFMVNIAMRLMTWLSI
jgi:type II secretory pathway component PulF